MPILAGLTRAGILPKKASAEKLVDAKVKHFLGAALIDLDSDEVIHAITDLMYAKKSRIRSCKTRGEHSSDRFRNCCRHC